MMNMKKFFLIFITLFFLTGCAGLSDWSYKLPNEYEIWRINSNSFIIKNTNTGNDVHEISSSIKEFAYDSRYVFTRNVENISNNIFAEKYYVLDTQLNKIYGPFDSTEQLTTTAEELDVELPEKWYRTSPSPINQ